jgi:hypothetical protein
MPMTFAVVQQRESEREVAGIYAIPLAIDGALNGTLDKPCAIRRLPMAAAENAVAIS